MEVVLKKDHDKLGVAMEVVKVKDGYARNFLIPQGIAVAATASNKKVVAELKKHSAKREDKKIAEAREQAKKIEKVPCTIKVKVGEEDRLFGSVTTQEIADFLTKEGVAVSKRDIELEDPIKQLGVYTVKVKLYKDEYANVKVWVVKDDAE